MRAIVVYFALCQVLAAAPAPIYRSLLLESFEPGQKPGRTWALIIRKHDRARGFASLANLERTAVPGESYLSVLVAGRPSSGVRIKASEPLRIPGIVAKVELYVYGFDRADELYADFQTAEGQKFRLLVGALNFRGWQKLAVSLPTGKQGRGERLVDGADHLFLRGFYLRLRADAGPTTQARLYLDDLRATVRRPHQAPAPRWD